MPFLVESFQEFLLGYNDVIYVNNDVPGNVAFVQRALFLRKKARTICLAWLTATYAFMGPGVPFFSHCFVCFFVSCICTEMADSSICDDLAQKAPALPKSQLWRQWFGHPSGTLLHHPKVSVRMAKMVPADVP
jgi:hypothetical protein